MATTSSIFTNPAYTGYANSTQAGTGKKSLDQQDFLNLLIMQLKNQDPLNPMKDTEFISQMANFSSLEQMTTMSKNMERLLVAQQLNTAVQQQQNSAGAVSLIGKEIVDVNGTTGMVTGVRLADDGVKLVVNGSEIAYSDVRQVRNPLN